MLANATSGWPGTLGWLLQKADDTIIFVHVHHAERGGLHALHLEAADGHVGMLVDVLLQHHLVIHLVDVITGQDDHVLRIVRLDDVDVLKDGVSRAVIPLRLADALRCGKNVEAFVTFGTKKVPAALQVADQAVRLVLRRDADAADARVERVREGKVDDARLAAEVHRRLGAPVGQLIQS
jgi:hypothetical protein